MFRNNFKALRRALAFRSFYLWLGDGYAISCMFCTEIKFEKKCMESVSSYRLLNKEDYVWSVDGCMSLQITGMGVNVCDVSVGTMYHPSLDHGDPVTGVTLLSPHIVGAATWPRRVSPPHPPSLFMCYHQSQYFQNKPRKLFLILHTSHLQPTAS